MSYIHGTFRRSLQPSSPRTPALRRTFQTSSSSSRKAQNAPAPSQDDDAEDELFSGTDSTPSTSPTSRSDRRSELIRTISSISSLPNPERKRAVSSTRVGILRKVAQLCEKPEELDELRGALRGWRVMGMRITAKTADEIIGRCCNLGRPELAVELMEDRLQYGLPSLSTSTLIDLHRTLLATSSTSAIPTLPITQTVSPSLALVRLVLLQRRSPDSSPAIESKGLLDRLEVTKDGDTTVVAEKRRRRWLGFLEKAGGAWAEAGRQVMASATVSSPSRTASA